jgi:uncharacterized membrane protein YgdD (TMEM256/DUF423 family)
MYKSTIISAAILGACAVILGALNAHAFKSFFGPDQTASFETGVKYEFIHSVVLLLLGITGYGSRWTHRLLLIGTIAFSFSIYILNFFKANGIIGLTGLGIVTPIGGLLLVAGWMNLIRDAFQSRNFNSFKEQ